MAHFDRERIPERVVHAKGAGAFGYFEVTHDITDLCKVGWSNPAFLIPNYSTTRIFEKKIPRPVIEKLRKCSSFVGPPQG